MPKIKKFRLLDRNSKERECGKMISACQGKSLYTIINAESGTVNKALAYIPENSRAEAIRLLKIVEESGQEEISALQALYRCTCGRDHYIEIYNGWKCFLKMRFSNYANKHSTSTPRPANTV